MQKIAICLSLLMLAGCATRMVRVSHIYSWEYVVKNSSDPSYICYYVRNGMNYMTDNHFSDNWVDSKTAFKDGFGDCEEFATVVRDMCAEKGIESDIYIVYSDKEIKAHAITIGKFGGEMWMASNAVYYDIKSVQDALDICVKTLDWETDGVKIEKMNFFILNLYPVNYSILWFLKNKFGLTDIEGIEGVNN